jgi:hypothetical protein
VPYFTRRTLLLGGACSLLAVSAAAKYPFRAPPEPYLPAPHIELEDASGQPFPRFRWRDGLYVLAEAGERYVIRIINPTSERLEAVVSVDGRDAVSGRVADYRRQRGYIVPAYGSVVVDGFRRSLGEVSAFRFTDPSDSYSARRGTPQNVGVVGAAFFRERRSTPRPRPRSHAPRDYSMDERSAPRARRPTGGEMAPSGRVNNLGTEYAEVHESPVREASFERRMTEPSSVTTLRYDDAEGLSARGIDIAPRWLPSEPSEPQAFPDSRFAEPPR